jgi:hypothetical protein
MNFHRGFDRFVFIRGQERDLYRSSSVGAPAAQVFDVPRDGVPTASQLPAEPSEVQWVTPEQSDTDWREPSRERRLLEQYLLVLGKVTVALEGRDPRSGRGESHASYGVGFRSVRIASKRARMGSSEPGWVRT